MYRERPLVTIAKSSHSAFGQKELKIKVSILFDGVIALGKKIIIGNKIQCMKKNWQASNNEDLNCHMFSRSHRRILNWFLSVQSIIIKKTRIQESTLET